MTCGKCKHRDMEHSPLKDLGYGLCRLERGLHARARTFSATARCNKNQYSPALPAEESKRS